MKPWKLNDFIWTPFGVRLEISVIFVLSLAFSIILSLSYGQDYNWDLANYHYYAPYALLHGRLDIDIAPSQLQTWFNPLPSLLTYFLITYFPPKIVAIVLSAIASVSILFVFLISISSLTDEHRQSLGLRWFVGAVGCVGAASSPIFLSELGTTFQDVLAGSFILGALALLLGKDFDRKIYFVVGILLGVAVGIKLTNAVYVVGFAVALIATERRRFLIPAVLSASGALLGYIPSGGIWAVYMYWQTGNPFFPTYNDIFHSPLYAPFAMVDTRFRPDGIAGTLRYFVESALGTHPGAEVKFADIRFLVSAMLLCGLLLSGRFWGKQNGMEAAESSGIFCRKKTGFILIFCVVSFAIWLPQFGIQRYAVALEQLAPLLILMMLALIAKNFRVWLVSSTICIVAIVATGERANWGRVPFTDDWFGIGVPESLVEGEALYVMLSGAPIAYVIPSFPSESLFVRIQSNMPLDPEMGLGRKAAELIASYEGPIRSLAPEAFPDKDAADPLAAFGLTIDPTECEIITAKSEYLRSCRMNRTSEALSQ